MIEDVQTTASLVRCEVIRMPARRRVEERFARSESVVRFVTYSGSNCAGQIPRLSHPGPVAPGRVRLRSKGADVGDFITWQFYSGSCDQPLDGFPLFTVVAWRFSQVFLNMCWSRPNGTNLNIPWVFRLRMIWAAAPQGDMRPARHLTKGASDRRRRCRSARARWRGPVACQPIAISGPDPIVEVVHPGWASP